MFDKKISEESLISKKSDILTKVEKKNFKFKTMIKPSKSNHILKEINFISCVEALPKNIIFVPIDKASKNVAIIYKQYYAEVILNEAGVIGHGKTLAAKFIKFVMRK